MDKIINSIQFSSSPYKKTEQISQYQDSAYNTQKIAHQPPRQEQGWLRYMMTKGHLFPFSQTNESLAISVMTPVTPAKMAEYEASNKKNNKGVSWDEKAFRKESYSPWSQVYILMVTIAKGNVMYILPLAYVLILFSLISGEGSIAFNWNDGWNTLFYGLSLYCTLPCLLISGHFKLLEYQKFLWLAPFLQSQREFELNRTTGMVTLFRKNKVFFTHPFIEFDCVLMSTTSHQGLFSYSLVLIHRYQKYSVGVPLSSLMEPNESLDEYYRFWNMIQCYMDISQPLPDIMILESARLRDPTTIAYDKIHSRKARYWRDMNMKQFTSALNKLNSKHNKLPATGKTIDIFQAESTTN